MAIVDTCQKIFLTLTIFNRNRGEGSFEVVQQHRASSYRQHQDQSKGNGGPQLNLGNRYNTLSNDS